MTRQRCRFDRENALFGARCAKEPLVKRFNMNRSILPALTVAVLAILAGESRVMAAESAERIYVKKATWAETMIATRANCAEWAKGQKEGQLSATPLPAVWRKIHADWPAHCAWFRQDLRGNRYLDWFLQSGNTHFETWILGQTAPRIGEASDPLTQELAELQRTKAASSDPRWLELYARARRLEDVVSVTRRLWLGELQSAFEGQAADMIRSKAPSEDARWAALKRWADQCLDRGAVAHVGSVGDLKSAVESLAAAMPERFSGGGAFLERLAEAEPKWNETIAGLLAQDADALGRLPTLHDEVRAFRRSLVAAVRGMPEFLGAWPHVDLEAEWEEQHAALEHDLADRARFDGIAPEVLRFESLVLPKDRDPADIVLRRTAALLADLRAAAAPKLAGLEQELAALKRANRALSLENAEARYVLFADVCRLRREIAFHNPLLRFDRLLFIKRHLAIYNHMCDQYYGITARPGGALCVLENPFRPDASPRELLADSVVQRGRLKGEKLGGGPDRAWSLRYDGVGKLSGDETEGGSFLSPDVSFDGNQIAFAYVQCTGDREHRSHTDPSRGHWPEGRCYHIFKVRADGSHLEQLSDGTWNDFDPCWMPSGRIAFISERRGGYLRCGRVCPTYTMYDMAADGSGIRCLSYHETNEWHPSVAHDGCIVWTRWDYVDRHGCTAHMPWMTTPDGRDPRPVHGNYAPRQSRPDMEVDVRAVPGSRKYIATAAPHHGQAFGSLVLIDPQIPDDDGMGPVKRITPDVAFPESQGGSGAYGAAWPLSEDYYLCVYDARMALRKPGAAGHYGIYLLDSFGNKELVYRDPEIGCHSPMPLRPRPAPPIIPDASLQLAGGAPAEAVVGVANVYDSRQSWPKGTKVKALRVYQVLPLSVESAAVPHNTGLQIPQASDSINLARAVLGTVPVEPDGSACFTVPAGKELYFQALDEEGLAITSMRSGTHFQPGERAMCQGCHEPRPGTPSQPSPGDLLAMRHAPSRLQPDVDGTNPFSYPRLVQPVLDKHCVECHAEDPDEAPRLDAGLLTHPGGGWMNRQTVYYASYLSLAPEYGFYDYGGTGWADPKWYRTTPGQFGARASKLYQLLTDGHYDVKLSPEELHRIVVWLDSCSVFYGVYEKEGGEAQLRGEIARPTLE